jgi:hypothetical protein
VVRRLKRAVKLVLETLPIVAACRRLAGRRLAGAPIALVIDIEPDNRAATDGAMPWRGFEEIARELVPPLRRQLSELTGEPAKMNWGLRLDDQIASAWGAPTWGAEEYREDLDTLIDQGDEIGAHVHPWRWDDEKGEWVVDRRPAFAAQCVNAGLDAYEEAFGQPAAWFRGGDGAMSGPIFEALTARGVAADMTLEYGLTQWKRFAGETEYGEPFDASRVEPGAYRSSPSRFPAPDPSSGSGPILMPLLGGPARRGRWAGTLMIGTHPTFFAVRLLGTLLRRKPRVLVFAVRADELLIRAWDPVVANLTHLARHPGARFATVGEALAVVDERAERRAPVAAAA